MQHPLSEYPRPALRRDSFESLNGPWQYAFTKAAQFPTAWVTLQSFEQRTLKRIFATIANSNSLLIVSYVSV